MRNLHLVGEGLALALVATLAGAPALGHSLVVGVAARVCNMALVVKSLSEQASSGARSANGYVLHSRACVSLAVTLAACDTGLHGFLVADEAGRLLCVWAVIVVTSACRIHTHDCK